LRVRRQPFLNVRKSKVDPRQVLLIGREALGQQEYQRQKRPEDAEPNGR